MDWEKYTGKKSAPRETSEVTIEQKNGGWYVTDPIVMVDDHTVRLKAPSGNALRTFHQELDRVARDVFGIERNEPVSIPEPLPTFDEVWESVQIKLESRAYDGLPMQQAIVAMVKDAARVMYETLTQEQNDE